MANGYPGDRDWDSNSGRGIGAFEFNSKPGSEVPGYDVGLKKSYAEKLGLKPGETFVPDHGEYKGKTVRWGDIIPADSPAPEDYIDGYEPNHAPDKGVSAATIAERKAIMEKAGINYTGSDVLPTEMGGATFKRTSTPVDFGATHKRVASQEEVDAAHQTEQQAPPAQEPQEPVAAPPTPPTAPTPPQAPVPQGAQPAAPISQNQVDLSEDPNEVLKAHSAALDPTDNRITRRINPDTGSNKLVGQYVVPGDPVHDKYFLSGLDPEDQAKLPWISDAIGQGGPFSYLYDSAQQYKPGGKVTGQSRAMEQAASTAEQRISGEHEAQMQRVTMLPMQLMATEPKQDSEGNLIPSNLLLEGFANDAVMNNARHLFEWGKKGGVQVPYAGPEDFNFQKDVSGYLHNQANGFRGDGSMMLDENGQPHPLWQANKNKPMPYVPHLLDRPRAEFVHAMLNIRPPKNPKGPTAPPGFGERAAWQRRVNEGYAGQTAGVNNLLAKLDKQFPDVRVYKARKNKETGEMEKYVHHHAPFSEASILEPTWRAYRLELMHHEMPPIGTESLRGPSAAHLISTAPAFKQTLASYRPHQGRGAEPIGENPEVGAPIGAGNHIDPERVTHKVKDDEVHWVPTHIMDEHWQRTDPSAYIGPGGQSEEQTTPQKYAGAFQHLAGTKKMHAPEVSIWDNGAVRFSDGRHRFAAMRDAGHTQVPIAFFHDSVQNAKNHGLIPQEGQPDPIGENPEVGGPIGETPEGGEPGALSQESTEQEAQAPPELPPATSRGIDFASPNIRDDMSFNTAKKALKGKEHAVVRNYADRLEGDLANQYRYQPARNIDTIGDYQQTAENTIMTPHAGQAQAHRRLALALKGLHGGQKQVLSFRHDDNGENYLYSLKFNHDKAEAVRDLLDQQGIKYRTFEPAQKGQPVGVHIVDFDGSIEPRLEKLFKKGHIREADRYRGNAELIGDENSRERAAQAFRRVLQEARDQDAQERAGRGGLHGGEAWFEPHAREAEENFERLRKLEEFEEQEIQNDHREAGVDRDQIPPDQTRELKRLNRIGKRLVAEDPSMAELDPRTNHAYKLGQKQFPRTDMKNADVGEYFDANHPRLDLINNQKDRETAAHIYYQDLIHSLAGTAHGGKPSTAYGWYDRTVRKTINKMAEAAPEILTDPDHELAFKLALAVTSQGQEVNPNAESSWHAYQYWKKHGEFPTDVRFFGDGQKYVQMEQNFHKLNELWAKRGTADLREFLQKKATVGDLKAKHDLTVAGEKVGHKVRGAMFMGPKVGAFFSNLMGHFDPVTMDMWWSRDFNKIAGNMFNFSEDTMRKGGDKYGPQIEELAKMLGVGSGSKHPKLEGVNELPAIAPPGEGEAHTPRPEGFLGASPEELEKMRDEVKALRAIPADKMDRPAALAAAPTIYKWAKTATRNYARSYGEKEGPRKRSFHEDFKTPENSLGKRMHENANKLKDDPRGGAEREAWREITGIVEKKLREQGIRLTNADKQALGWFNIKDVFALAGANAVRNADYLDAAYTLTRRIKNGDLPDLTNG